MSVVEYPESSFQNNGTLSAISNDVSIDPSYDGVVMLSSDLHLFGDANIRPDGRKIFHIFERAPEDDQGNDDYPCKAPQKNKEDLWLKACLTTFKNIEEIMLQNGITLDEWCPLLSESVQNSRNNTSDATKRRSKTSALKYFRNHAKDDMKEEVNYQETSKKLGSSKGARNKQGKENGDSFPAEDEECENIAFSTHFVRKDNKDKSNVEKFSCFNCGYETLYKHNLRAHIFRHCAKRVKLAPGGKLGSGRRANFKNKLILPAKDRYYLCDMCNFSTRNRNNLKTHKTTHLNEKKFVCPFCGYASSTLSRTENHIRKMHEEPIKEELGSEKLNKSKKDPRKNRRVSEEAGKQDNSKFNNIKTESKTIKDKSRDHFTAKSSQICVANCRNLRNVNKNCTVELNKCIDLHAKEAKVSERNNTKKNSKFDDNVTSVKEEVQIFNENVTVKEERHTEEVDYDVDDNITTFKEEIPIKFECNDDENVTSVQEEFETHVKFDGDDSSYTEECKENQHQDSKRDVFDDKQKFYSSFDLIRIENSVNEFNPKIKQEAKFPSNYSNNSDSFTEHDENIEVKSENFNSIADENVNPRCLRFTRESDKKGRFEVIKETNSGISTMIFKSLECPYSCLSRYKIIQHCRTHENNKTYNCMDCNFTAKCLFLLKRHKKSHTENLFRCSTCSFVAKSASTLRKHTYIQHSKSRSSYVASKLRKKSVKFKDLECNMCSFITIDRNKYEDHMKIHLRNKRKTGARRTSRASTLARTAKISENLKQPTNRHASQISKMKTRRILVKKKFKCDKCTFFTYSMEKLTNHKKSHVKPKSTEINDSKEASSKDKVKKEKVDQSSQSNFHCKYCSFTAFLKIDFLKHKQIHEPLTAGLFKCTECSFSAAKYKVLVSHLMTHAYEYLYRCIHCNFSSNNKSTLKSHKDLHRNPRIKTNNRLFRGNKVTIKPKNNQVLKCFRCDYFCTTEHLLNQHALSHFENKILKCADCDYETNFKGNLVRHVLIHIDEYIIN